MSAFSRLAHAVIARPVTVIVAWSGAVLACFALAYGGIPGQGNILDRTATGPPLVKGSESYEVFAARRDAHDPDAGTVISGRLAGVNATDPATYAALAPALADLAQTDHVAMVATAAGAIEGPEFSTTTIPPNGGDPSVLIGADGNELIVVVTVGRIDDTPTLRAVHNDLKAQLQNLPAATGVGTSVEVFSEPLLYEHFEKVLAADLVVGEGIALPLALIVMVLVFGGFLAASTPIIGAMASIAGGLAVLYGFTFVYDVDESAQNVVTVLGLGLCIDYGLLIVSRYREELVRATAPPPGEELRGAALVRAMETAGRTVFFSAITVGVSVSGMMLFKPEITKAFGAAALGVVVVAMLTAMTLVPAVAYLYGERLKHGLLSHVPGVRRLLKYTSDVERDEGAFSRLAAWVQRRPWLVLGATTALLLVLAAPALGLQMRNSEAELLPQSSEFRQYLADFDEQYPALAEPAIDLLSTGTVADLDSAAAPAADLPGVTGVDPAHVEGDSVFGGVRIDNPDGGSAQAVETVRELRDAADGNYLVGGQAANQIDFVTAVRDGAPFAFGLVIVATFVLLFLMTGSVLVPLKTLVINALSLTASVGAMVWVFQEGHLQGILGFDSTGGVETYVVVLIVSFGFGLAMDYEVFLLARIKEAVDRGLPNNDAVRLGLQRSGRIVTSAALIVVIVFLGFAAGKTLVIKEVGVGLAFAVLLDATVVRMLLVPATMTLLGDWNWWAPKGLKKLYARMAITH